MRAAFSKRELVMDFLGRNVEPALQTHFAQRVLRDVAVPDTLPSASIPAFCLRTAVIFFIACVFLLLMHRAVPTVSKVGTAGIGAGPLGFPWHLITSLYAHKKSPAGAGSHKASVCFSLSIIILS